MNIINIKNAIKKGLAVAFMLPPSLYAFSQVEHTHSLLMGFGTADVLDSYLSPYSYTGSNAHFQFDTERPNCYTQLDLNGSYTHNHAGNIDGYGFGIRYTFGIIKTNESNEMSFTKVNGNRKLKVAFHPEASAYLGGAYIDRSGNNPGNVHANITLNAAVRASYCFSVKNKQWNAGAQVSVPMIGAAFSPNYGQSYYEAFCLGNYDHNVVFCHPFNMPSLRCRATLDIPVGKHETTLRIAYSGQFDQSKFNHLKHHYYTHDFMIGYTKTLYRK